MPKLYVVATPIGNLNDLSPRMEQALREADLIAAEDTRVTMKLLNHLGISKPMISYHQHNEDKRSDGLIQRMLAEDLTLALTSDAGTPAISDPGQVLVDAAWEAGISVVPISGPSAVITALSAAGFETREFAFYGFLPREKKLLRAKLNGIYQSRIPIAVAYESPHRIIKLVEEITAVLPECSLAVCCDLTKRYEKILRGNCHEVLSALRQNPNVEKGEYCVVMDLSALSEPSTTPETTALHMEALLFEKMLSGLNLKDASDALISSGCARNEVYRAHLAVKEFFRRQAEEAD